MSAYSDYCAEQKALGQKPLSMKEWAAQRYNDPVIENDPEDAATVDELRARVIEPDPEPEVVEEPDQIVFFHPSRFHVEVMQAGQKVVINNSIVTMPHRVIEFTENHWTADMRDQDDREKAEWLMQCKEYRKGTILRVDRIIHQPRVEVRTGPRTTGHNAPKQRDPRPAGELSAPLN